MIRSLFKAIMVFSCALLNQLSIHSSKSFLLFSFSVRCGSLESQNLKQSFITFSKLLYVSDLFLIYCCIFSEWDMMHLFLRCFRPAQVVRCLSFFYSLVVAVIRPCCCFCYSTPLTKK